MTVTNLGAMHRPACFSGYPFQGIILNQFIMSFIVSKKKKETIESEGERR